MATSSSVNAEMNAFIARAVDVFIDRLRKAAEPERNAIGRRSEQPEPTAKDKPMAVVEPVAEDKLIAAAELTAAIMPADSAAAAAEPTVAVEPVVGPALSITPAVSIESVVRAEPAEGVPTQKLYVLPKAADLLKYYKEQCDKTAVANNLASLMSMIEVFKRGNTKKTFISLFDGANAAEILSDLARGGYVVRYSYTKVCGAKTYKVCLAED